MATSFSSILVSLLSVWRSRLCLFQIAGGWGVGDGGVGWVVRNQQQQCLVVFSYSCSIQTKCSTVYSREKPKARGLAMEKNGQIVSIISRDRGPYRVQALLARQSFSKSSGEDCTFSLIYLLLLYVYKLGHPTEINY
jgi:hypothetical protein